MGMFTVAVARRVLSLKADNQFRAQRRLLLSVGLSLLFLLIYGACLWVTAGAVRRGSSIFPGSEHLFVPFMILPYMSIDLFFVACAISFSRCAGAFAFAARVASAIFLAGVCFLISRFASPFRDRMLRVGWAPLRLVPRVDAPYKLIPSLHAALLLFLIDAYARHLRRPKRFAVMSWFVLIGLSPLLTHQHHVIDILGGFALAALCFFFIRPKIYLDSAERSP